MDTSSRQILERDIQQSVSSFFSERLGEAFEVVHEYRDKGKHYQDIAIIYNRHVIAFIECKRNAEEFVLSHRVNYWLERLYANEEAMFYFVVDAQDCYLFQHQSYTPRKLSFEDAISILKSSSASAKEKPTIEEISLKLKDVAKAHRMLNLIKPFADSLTSLDIKYDASSPIYSFSTNKEDELFLMLLKRVNGIRLCRYTTINSLFDLFKNEKQNMCNIVCMNDRGEYKYADNYVFGRYPQLGTKDFKELDDCFILSLLDKSQEDNLTMWRLYGDNARGASITYEAKRSIQNGIQGQFFLANVSYGQKNGVHPKLEFIKDLLDVLTIRGWQLNLTRWNIWKHFFKSNLFAVEKEVRLMYYDAPIARTGDKDFIWIKNPNSQIVSKMQLFDFSLFPLKVVYAKVGPNCNEADLLARQFELMAKSTSLKNVSLDWSRIDDYR